MKWNWFAPLPPAGSGIADYTANLLPVLAAHAEITLWTNCDGWDPRLETHANVRVADGNTLFKLHEADANFYHLGNNHLFHSWIWDIAQRHPGIVVLHDSHLQHFFYGHYLHLTSSRGRYVNQMARWYGANGREAALDLLQGNRTIESVSQEYPLTVHAVEKALAVVVHTTGALEQLCINAHLPLVHAALPYDPSTPEPERKVPGCPTEPEKLIRLVLVGHIGSNRRLESILTALATFPCRDRFRLDVYGAVALHSHFERQIAKMGLAGQVMLHGFVSEEDLDRELSQCDLAFNLRYPSMGEGSLSQLRYWEHALPTLVTPTGWYGTLPEDVVGFVDVQNEQADIYRHLQELLSNPEMYRKMGNNGRKRLLEFHSSAAYVETLKQAVERVPEFRRHFAARRLADRVGCVVGGWGVEQGADELYARAARRILELSNPS
ncbi:glycosyltransferase [Verrucomicrobium spinosum]|uniref:glycosyltransferase n=1 Tax=Verrucomicrobium spinosum TaxID=2736 RepID=UPI00017462CC|nr:glycosyltransferase [Verrucomicrobium spinosum]